MNDDQLPMSAETASAYLDGELDATDRAAAAADPDTMAMVDTFAQVRAQLSRVVPVVDSTRTAAMAAALSEFDAIHAAATSPTPVAPAIVTSLLSHRRMRAYRLLTGVAAAAVIAVVGIAALNSSGRDSRFSSVADKAPAATAAAARLPALEALDTAAATEAAAGSTEIFAATADSAGLELPAIESATALAEYAAGIEVGRSTAAPAESPPSSHAAAQQSPSPAYPLPACLASNQLVLGTIIYQGVPAFAVRDTIDDTVRAIDVVDCRVLVSVDP